MKVLKLFVKSSLIVVLVAGSTLSFGQLTARQKRNLDAFANLYGYVRFFHPSDEANDVNQARFAAYGSLKMLEIKNDAELVAALNYIFKPIAPTAKIFLTRDKLTFKLKEITPEQADLYNQVSWQHLGINPHHDDKMFTSIRINRPDPSLYQGFFYAPIMDTLDLKKFEGKKFEISFFANAPKKDSTYQQLKVSACRGYLRNIKDVFFNVDSSNYLIDSTRRKYIFSGIIDKGHAHAVWSIAINPVFRLSIDSIKLNIYDANKATAIALKSSPYVNKYYSGTISNYTFLFEKSDAKNTLYDTQLKIGQYLQKELIPGLSVIMPLVVYGDDTHTYPIVPDSTTARLNKDMFDAMQKNANGEIIDSGDIPGIRFANIVMSWNVIKNACTSWDHASLIPMDVLNNGLDRAFSDKNSIEFFKSLKSVYAPLNDGQLEVYLNDNKVVYENAFAPVTLDSVNDKIVVTSVNDSSAYGNIVKGDEVVSINDQPAVERLIAVEKLISGSPQWKTWKGLQALTAGPENSIMKMRLRRSNKNFEVKLTRDQIGSYNGRSFVQRDNKLSGWIKPGIYYLNLNADSIENHVKELAQAKSFIFDLRNNSVPHNLSVLSHFVKADRHISLYSYPEINYPDLEHVAYQQINLEIKPASPYLTKNMVFITDGSTAGGLEELALYVKQQKLGTLIGDVTSGSYAGANYFRVLGDYSISFTGLKLNVLNQGRQGITPDISVLETAKLDGDYLLKAAVSYAEKKANAGH